MKKNEYLATVNFLKKKLKFNSKNEPQVAIILGSGLGEWADNIEKSLKISYSKIPSFLKSTVAGHAGELIYGKVNGVNVICMKGRFHFYEGYKLSQITYPIKIFKQLGVKKLILTNAAGGVNRNFSPGNLMIIKDHINFMGTNPLLGPNEDKLGTRFPDMSEIYSRKLQAVIAETAKELQIGIQQGVYLATMGPSYETPAEINAFRILGADAVGMSTVPEAIIGNWLGLEVAAISCITNMAAGTFGNQKLSHSEVTETANIAKKDFMRLISAIIGKMAL